ncbi:AraC family transcriptional regulator [Aquibacillus albus]|uniref:YesN/AraC family two-component response regulator n=1 Tax=Aquibacillus albus TaxID=1168171 RepID=A0ABS2N3J2_9BACI|nr:AraC family transcriptional regulator [Aquibacillus albus]MBM7572711.1 YesN/AraC family two-component response regulator [Aquibacillus albus]
MLQFFSPPLPSLIAVGEDTYKIGETHSTRFNIGLFDLLIVTKGCLFMGENNQEYVVEEGMSLILYPDGHHFSTYPCKQETHFYWFHFNPSQWSVVNESQTNNTNHKDFLELKLHPFKEHRFPITLQKLSKLQNWDHFKHICEQILKVNSEVRPSWEWQQQLQFQQLLQELSSLNQLEKSSQSVVIAEEAASFIKKNFTRKIGYKELGQELSFHPNHISRCMMEVLGYSPIEYLNKTRLDHAKLLLVSKQWSVEKISEECGFSQFAYFSRLFKKHEGIAPSKFRKKYLGKK